MDIVKKVVIVGYFGVGKTSLVRQFVHQQFSDQYLTTIGVKIDKKVVEVGNKNVKIMLWDIAGESSALKVPQKYLSGAHGLIYVFDMSRPETYQDIENNIFNVQKIVGSIPSIVLGNKSDLLDDTSIEDLRNNISISFNVTSAKTGHHIEDSFLHLAQQML